LEYIPGLDYGAVSGGIREQRKDKEGLQPLCWGLSILLVDKFAMSENS
jgi:hypothetical protein